MPKNIFVLGLDDLNAETLRTMPNADELEFHGLLRLDELRTEDIRLPELLASAERQLYDFDGPIDAIIGYWDFPVTVLVAMLCDRFGLIGPSLESVVRCEHKYWSRLEQEKVIREHPNFEILDPRQASRPPPGWDYPLWIKPVKSVGSALAFHVKNDDEFRHALDAIRKHIDWMGAPFQAVLDRIDAPAGIAASGRACLVEEDVAGAQVTVEGYVRNGEPYVYGIVGSFTYPGKSSFLRYQYPSSIPWHVADRLTDLSERVVTQVELNNSTFNIEYFWDPRSDEVKLLEINPRHSQSHARLFQMVDGVPNHYAIVNLALGRDPAFPYREGRHQVAAKWFLRRFDDGTAIRVPTPQEVARVERKVQDVKVDVEVREGERLSDHTYQDSYSYKLAEIFIGASNEDELVSKYERCVAELPFSFEP